MSPSQYRNSSSVVSFAEVIGEALGRGVARGLDASLASSGGRGRAPAAPAGRRGRRPGARGRPAGNPKPCKIKGCPNPARSKGLCSKHYQAARRRQGKGK